MSDTSLCPWHIKFVWKSSETFVVSARRATMLPRFATGRQHRRTQSCRHNVASICRDLRRRPHEHVFPLTSFSWFPCSLFPCSLFLVPCFLVACFLVPCFLVSKSPCWKATVACQLKENLSRRKLARVDDALGKLWMSLDCHELGADFVTRFSLCSMLKIESGFPETGNDPLQCQVAHPFTKDWKNPGSSGTQFDEVDPSYSKPT